MTTPPDRTPTDSEHAVNVQISAVINSIERDGMCELDDDDVEWLKDALMPMAPSPDDVAALRAGADRCLVHAQSLREQFRITHPQMDIYEQINIYEDYATRLEALANAGKEVERG